MSVKKQVFNLGQYATMHRLCGLLVLILAFQSPVFAQPDDENIDGNLFSIDQILEQARRADSDVEKEHLANQCLKMSLGASRIESGIVQANIILGEVASRAGRIEKALSHFLEAENRAIAGKNLQFLPVIYAAMGDLFYSQKLYENAIRFYKIVVQKKPSDLVFIEKLADSYMFSVKKASSKNSIFIITTGINNAGSDSEFIGEASNIQAIPAPAGKDINKLRFDSAEFLYKILISRYNEENNNTHLIQVYQKLASAYEQQGNAGKQLLYYTRIEAIVDKFGKPFERGRLYNNLGKVHASQGRYAEALDNFKKTEIQCQFAAISPNKPCENEELLYINMGIALHNTGKTKDGLAYLFRAIAILKARNDQVALASLEHIIATVYFNVEDRYNALAHNEAAITYAKAANEIDVLSRSYRTASQIYQDLYDFEKAFEYYNNYLELSDKIRLDEQRRELVLSERSSQLRAAESEIKYLIVQKEIKEKDLEQSRERQLALEKDNQLLAADARKKELDVKLLQQSKKTDSLTFQVKIALAMEADQKLRTAARELEIQKKNAELSNYEQQAAIDEAEKLASDQKVTLLNREKELSDLQLSANRNFQKNTYILGSLGGLMLFLMGIGWWYARRTGRRLRLQNQKIEAQKNQIETERGKSDRLLRNILPDEIAEELKTRGHADPKLYDSATVLFTDFVNFTKLSSSMQPEKIISELDECFLAFDEIIEKHGLEKIKTIGDAFMCAGGLPVPNTTHAIDAVRAAIEINDWMKKRNAEKPDAIFREMRVGIHTGPVVAGVIGKNKFAYDIWGDAVNLASRLEEQGENGQVNISQSTYEAIKDQFVCTWRGKREVHNKGLVDMYFVNGDKKAATF
jgi:class 3 adenylate cyclase